MSGQWSRPGAGVPRGMPEGERRVSSRWGRGMSPRGAGGESEGEHRVSPRWGRGVSPRGTRGEPEGDAVAGQTHCVL